jgi:hypothetical protein
MIVEINDKPSWRPKWVEPKYMDKLGYELISDKDGYLKYGNKAGIKVDGYGIMPKHKRFIYFNTTYKPYSRKVFVSIREDGDTRTVYNGVCKGPVFLEQLHKHVR